ncbi:MAG: SDR family oxidoreductase [bacterium]|nr:SDR family oxidoreductase [bacterium]
MAHYLVTGGAGFIGSNIVEYLIERGERVRVLDDFSTGKRENIEPFLGRIELIEGELRDEETCRRAGAGVDYVLHQAAMASVPRSIDEPVMTSDINVLGTIKLLTAAARARVRRLVYAASSSAYGDQPTPAKVESLPPSPLSPYAAAKLAGEYFCQAFSQSMGLETVCLRYFNVFGPRQDPKSQYSAVIPLFVTAVIEGRRPTIFGDGGQTRDFTYVENNVRANILAATAPAAAVGRVINVACGTSYSLLDLLAIINATLGKSIEPVFAPARVGDVRHSLADITLARELLDFEVAIDFEAGMRRTIEWYLTHAAAWAGR